MVNHGALLATYTCINQPNFCLCAVIIFKTRHNWQRKTKEGDCNGGRLQCFRGEW